MEEVSDVLESMSYAVALAGGILEQQPSPAHSGPVQTPGQSCSNSLNSGLFTVSSVGTRSKYANDLFLTPPQRLRAMRVLADLAEQYSGRITADAGPLAEWRMFTDMEKARREVVPIPGRGRLVGCGCIFERLAVLADGTYVPCVMLPQTNMGKMGEVPLEEVWQHAPALTALRDRVAIPLSAFEECRECEYAESCTGSCPGTSVSLLGEANRPSPEACLRKFKEDLARCGLTLWED